MTISLKKEGFSIDCMNIYFNLAQEEIDFKVKLFKEIISQNFYLKKNFGLINR